MALPLEFQLEFHPEARAEFEAAVEHYEAERRGLGRTFADAVRVATRHIAEAPAVGAPFTGGTRRIFIRRFPYALIYATDERTVVVLAVAHFRRRPGYWRTRVE